MARRDVFPGGYGRSSLAVGEVVPVADRADGPRIWCEDGRELLDFNNNFASLVHGHAQPAIVAAGVKALATGSSFGISNELELAHAELLLERLPHADQIRYTNSGTEAVMTAVRLARAATGRSRLLLFERAYHGTSDVVLPALGESSRRGVPDVVASETTLLPINDVSRLELEIDRDPPAALLMDLLPNQAGMVPVSDEYIERARELCTRHGVVLIVDEVISLRLGWNGLGGELGLRPDITVTGKMIGGGFPVGALAGTKDLMAELNPLAPSGLPHGGTFSANRVTMAAGCAALELLTAEEIARINALGDGLRNELSGLAPEDGWKVVGRGSMIRLLADGMPDGSMRDLWWAAFQRGILITPSGLMTVSTAMTDDIIEAVPAKLADAMAEVNGGKVVHSLNREWT